MTKREEYKQKAEEIFQEVFDQPELKIFDEMVAQDVPDWDSLNHITLVVSLEEEFNLKFTTKEVMSWKNVGEMLDTLTERVN
jgi:acyl carrier protein